MIFFDTSIFVAATQKRHTRHNASLDLLAEVEENERCCAAQTIAELYSVLTRSPRPQRLSPGDAVAVLDLLKRHMKIVELDVDEQFKVIRELASRGLSGGIVHDALIMQCAKRIAASKIYTLNPRHFRLVAPELAELVFEP